MIASFFLFFKASPIIAASFPPCYDPNGCRYPVQCGASPDWTDAPDNYCRALYPNPPPNQCNAAGDWQFAYIQCQTRQHPDEYICMYQDTWRYITCSAADRCEGATGGGGTGYASNGHVVAGQCNAGAYVPGNPTSACTNGGWYKQCCSPGGGYPTTACSNGSCPSGSITGVNDTTCSDPLPGQPSVGSAGAACVGTSASVTFSYSGGSGATWNEVRYSANSPTLDARVTLGSSPYTINGFSPGNRIYYNVYACNAAGCTPDYNGYYYVDLPATCGTVAPPTPTNTPIPGYSCGGTCGTSSSPQGQACGSGGTWQWDGQPSAASITCRTNPNTYCYTCVNPLSTPTPTPVGPTPTPISGTISCSGATSGVINSNYSFQVSGGSNPWTWSPSGGTTGGVTGSSQIFTTRFTSTGNYNINVSSAGRSANCPISIGSTGAGWSMSSSPTCVGTRSAITTTYTVPSGWGGQLCYTVNGGTSCIDTAGTGATPLTGTGTYTTTTGLISPGSTFQVYLQIPAGAIQQGPHSVVAKSCSPPTCSGPNPTSPVVAGTSVTYTAGGGGGSGTYSWTRYQPPSGSAVSGGSANSMTFTPVTAGTYQTSVTSGGLTTVCPALTVNPAITCTSITSNPNPMVGGTASTITMNHTGNATSFNWGSLTTSYSSYGGCSTSSSVCNNFGTTTAATNICQPTTLNITGAAVNSTGFPSAACPSTTLTINPRHSVSGSLYLDYGSNNCASGSLPASIARTITLNNVSSGASITSDSTAGNNYVVTDNTNFCGSLNRSLTLSNLPAGYTIAGYRRASSGAFIPLSGFTVPPFTYTSNTAIDQVDWCISPASPWYQTTTGDVRFPSLSNSLPTSTTRAATDPTSPSVFFSSSTTPAFGAATTPSALGWLLGREYQYNNDFQQGLGSASYTFYKSQARKKGITPTSIGGAIDPSTLATGVYQTSAANATISACNPIPANKHVILLVDNAATLTVPASSCPLYAQKAAVKVNAGGGLFVLAAKGNITIDSSVGTTNSDDLNTQLDGYYTSEGSIILATKQSCSTGVTDNRLNVGGALIANSLRPFASTSTGGKVVNNRSLCGGNITYPSYKVYARPDFVTQLTDFYKTTYKTFKEVSP